MLSKKSGTVLLYSIHRTQDWFKHLGANMDFQRSYVVSCLPGEGDFCVVNDFKRYQALYYSSDTRESNLLTSAEVHEVIARCRVLRFMGPRRASAMVLAMAEAFSNVLDRAQPDVIVSFPIDRYVSDVLAIMGEKRGIPFFELTVSPLPGMSMLMRRGMLRKHRVQPNEDTITHYVDKLTRPLFKPSYVAGITDFTQIRFIKIFFYYQLRGFVFWWISLWKRDKLNLHYLDAQRFLGHKPSLTDRHVTSLVDRRWREKIVAFEKDRRVLFGLQLFPEASIDYWIRDLSLIEHEDVVFEAAEAFSKAGYCVIVKDHPKQFGFRQLKLIRRLIKLPNTIFIPYEVSGMEILNLCGVNFTCTGTLGLQAALIGAKSVTVRNYYSTEEDFVFIDKRADIAMLPSLVAEFPEVDDLKARQQRIISNLLRGSFKGEFFSFQGFKSANPSLQSTELGNAIGQEIRKFLVDGEC